MNPWDPALLALVEAMLADGLSAALVAVRIGRTKNAVISAMHRYGRANMPRKPTTTQLRPAVARRKASGPFKEKRKKFRFGLNGMSADDAVVYAANLSAAPAFLASVEALFSLDKAIDPVSFADLEGGRCRWPCGATDNLDDFRFCGATVHHRAYCQTHAVLAYGAKP